MRDGGIGKRGTKKQVGVDERWRDWRKRGTKNKLGGGRDMEGSRGLRNRGLLRTEGQRKGWTREQGDLENSEIRDGKMTECRFLFRYRTASAIIIKIKSTGGLTKKDAGLMCPRLMCPRPKVLGCCAP